MDAHTIRLAIRLIERRIENLEQQIKLSRELISLLRRKIDGGFPAARPKIDEPFQMARPKN